MNDYTNLPDQLDIPAPTTFSRYLLRTAALYKGGKQVYQKATSFFFVNFFARTTEKVVEVRGPQLNTLIVVSPPNAS